MFWTLTTFIVPPRFVWLTRLLLKSRDGRACVVCLMSAIFQRARQHKFSRPQRLALFRSIACIEGEQNGHVALLAANTEIPPQVGLRPSRNIQRISLTSEMPQLELRQQGWAAVVSRGPPDRVCPIANDETAKVATPTKPITPNPPESLSPSHIYRMARFLPDIIAVLSFHPFKREVLEARIRILLEVFDRHEEDSPEMNRRESTQLA